MKLKKIIVLLVMLMFFTSVYAEEKDAYIFSDGMTFVSFNDVAFDANNYVAVGTSDTDNLGLITKGSGEEVLWKKNIGSKYEPAEFYKVVVVGDGYIAVGSIGHHGIIVKYDKEGNVKWQSKDETSDSVYQCLYVLKSGKIIVVGYNIKDSDSSNVISFISRYTSTGVLEKKVTFDSFSIKWDMKNTLSYFQSAINSIDDNSILIALNNNDGRGYILKTNGDFSSVSDFSDVTSDSIKNEKIFVNDINIVNNNYIFIGNSIIGASSDSFDDPDDAIGINCVIHLYTYLKDGKFVKDIINKSRNLFILRTFVVGDALVGFGSLFDDPIYLSAIQIDLDGKYIDITKIINAIEYNIFLTVTKKSDSDYLMSFTTPDTIFGIETPDPHDTHVVLKNIHINLVKQPKKEESNISEKKVKVPDTISDASKISIVLGCVMIISSICGILYLKKNKNFE